MRYHKLLRHVFSLGLFGLLVACGSPAPKVAPEEATPFGVAQPTTGASPASLLKRRDAPPEGVTDEIPLFEGGSGLSCEQHQISGPAVRVVPAPLSGPAIVIGQLADICLWTFDLAQPLEIAVTTPDGRTVRNSADTPNLVRQRNGWQWVTLPGDPPGDYAINVQQGGRSAADRFTVARAAEPNVLVLPRRAPAGSTFLVYLSGFAASRSAQLFLYRYDLSYPDCPMLCYTAALPPIPVDEHGEAIYALKTAADDMATIYALEPSPQLERPRLFRQFQVGLPVSQAPSRIGASSGLLKRRDTPPEGVQRQVSISFGWGAGGGCASGLDEPPEIEIGQPPYEVGWSMKLCIKGFAPHPPLDLELMRPDGSRRKHRIASSSTMPNRSRFEWNWQTRATDQPGTYTMTAIQGERRAQLTFTLAAASKPRLWDVPGYRLAPGSAAEIHIAGYPPDIALTLHIYRSGGTEGCTWDAGCFDYYTTLTSITTSANGTAVMTIKTNPDDGTEPLLIVSDDDARATGRNNIHFALLWLVVPPPFPGVLRAGDSGEEVRKIQTRLSALGYDEVGRTDSSLFDPDTEAAVRSFQQRNGLALTGVVDALTWERLFGPDGVGDG